MKYQVKVFNPVTKQFKMVGPVSSSIMALEEINKKMCVKVWRTGLMVRTVSI